MAEHPAKRQRLSDNQSPTPSGPASLTRNVSPPARRSVTPARPALDQKAQNFHQNELKDKMKNESSKSQERDGGSKDSERHRRISPKQSLGNKQESQQNDLLQKFLPSPFRLTTIRDLPPEANVGAVSLHDLLKDPLISDCWEFNYLHDIEFLMSHFDEDVKSLVRVHIVHGFWKREDSNRLLLEEQAKGHKNVTLHTAYMPEPFGTHHTKMMILFRHDDTAQVIIHTANMIEKDWTNMTNAVWQSPALPLSRTPDYGLAGASIGSGEKFKADILSYLRAYGNKCGTLVDSLAKYDFAAVKGALIASVPGRYSINDDPDVTRWGWTAMKHALRSVPVQPGNSEVVVQVSSIATLGATDAWLQKTLFDSLSSLTRSVTKPDFKVVFPTADEIRYSLDGYASGGSIHTKIQSSQQQKQLQYLRPILCHWDNSTENGVSAAGTSSRLGRKNAGRHRAAPHIKTYIRYNSCGTIDWALFTSANISKQAWGEATNGMREVRIASFEVGVLVWPELITGEPGAKMVGVFKKDEPVVNDLVQEPDGKGSEAINATTLVGVRIPYNLPLSRYGPTEKPWVATANHSERDWMGASWNSWA